MLELNIIIRDGGTYIDSREVAEIIGKRHDNLLRDIGKYRDALACGGLLKIEESDFFVESHYLNTQNKTMPCYLISRLGAEVIANKLTGEKGILFTFAYVSKFNEMEAAERAARNAKLAVPAARYVEVNACARTIVWGMKLIGASPERIMEFLNDTYKPLGIPIDIELDSEVPAQRWYKAGEIAKEYRLYSLYGKPHSQAVACILNENLFISPEHKRVETDTYGDYPGVRVLYDDYARTAVINWLIENGFPDEIYGFDRTYHVQYLTECKHG